MKMKEYVGLLGFMVAVFGGGGLVALYATWLSLALVTLVTLIILLRYAHAARERIPSDSQELLMITAQGIMWVGWFGAAIVRPLYELVFRGNTISIVLDQFIR